MTQLTRSYEGPACPRCRMRLTADWLYSGTVTCPDCGRPFEATLFTPPERRVETAPVALIAVAGEGNACANHARNAAVATCQRCGLFICTLCDMDIGTGPHCPACFDRMREDGSLAQVKRRFRDYSRMVWVALVAGLVFGCAFLGLPFGVVSLIYARKALAQLRQRGSSLTGIYVAISLAILECLVGSVMLAFFVYGLFVAAKGTAHR